MPTAPVGPRRAALEARLAAEPELAAALAAPARGVARLIARRHRRAPLSLRMRVEELEPAQPPVRAPPRWRPGGRARDGRRDAGDVVGCWRRGARRSTSAGRRPAPGDRAGGRWRRSSRACAFREYEQWRATGERTDVMDGRPVRTVFYERDGRDRVRDRGRAGTSPEALRMVRADGVAVTWTRHGRTCVIAASGGDAAALARLAVW